MKIKTGVKVSGIQPEMTLALMVIHGILMSHGQELVITSVKEGPHSKRSRHYIGYAVDVRSRDIEPDSIPLVESQMQSALGAEYFVQFERNHFHIQFNGSNTT